MDFLAMLDQLINMTDQSPITHTWLRTLRRAVNKPQANHVALLTAWTTTAKDAEKRLGTDVSLTLDLAARLEKIVK